jgi:hypothetical protein
MLEFGDVDRDGLLNFDELFRFYLAIIKFPMKKASETAQSFIDLGDKNKDEKLSLRGTLSHIIAHVTTCIIMRGSRKFSHSNVKQALFPGRFKY